MEPDPRNVRRLQSLEADLKSLSESTQALVTERDDLRRRLAEIETTGAERENRVGELEAALAEAQKTLLASETGDQKISQLIEENRRLAAHNDIMTSDLDVMRGAAEEAKAGLDATRVETEAHVRAELADQIKAIQDQRDSLQTQLNIVIKQLRGQGKTPLLAADKVAEMLNGLVDQMQGGLGGLRIIDGEVKLKVGFGAVGDVGGFVIPTTDSTPELLENLQEVTLRFDRNPEKHPARPPQKPAVRKASFFSRLFKRFSRLFGRKE